ncbi:MAG: hypothetical protein FWD17_06680 [Polyangiaceae bacterium]|nr:hypothetical protein [Polyangiaceae bacterium]
MQRVGVQGVVQYRQPPLQRPLGRVVPPSVRVLGQPAVAALPPAPTTASSTTPASSTNGAPSANVAAPAPGGCGCKSVSAVVLDPLTNTMGFLASATFSDLSCFNPFLTDSCPGGIFTPTTGLSCADPTNQASLVAQLQAAQNSFDETTYTSIAAQLAPCITVQPYQPPPAPPQTPPQLPPAQPQPPPAPPALPPPAVVQPPALPPAVVQATPPPAIATLPNRATSVPR